MPAKFSRFFCAAVASAVCACSHVGPASVQRDRIDYGIAIGDTWKQQTLLNIVRLRYGDFPVFLDISQVVAGYQLEGTVGVGADAANISSGGPFALGANAGVQGKYTERPTVMYAPLTGNNFLKALLTPIPTEGVLFLLQAGYNANLVLPIAVNSINSLNNQTRQGAPRSADPRFVRMIELIRELQTGNALGFRIGQRQEKSDVTTMTFPALVDTRLADKLAQLKAILGLRTNLREFAVRYGTFSEKDDEISMATRSMLQIMLELSADVEVPPSDVDAGRAGPGAMSGQPLADLPSAYGIHITSGESHPQDAYVTVPYNGRWFWITNDDMKSKLTFGFVMLLFSISDTGTRLAAPIVTVPASP